ncbi:hypothetical protein BDR03DRAFT_550406 [Suillus americanus]|nr:hypothetical protein BDR03DRAFT_550406 [Suillus americanus]
MGGKATSQLMSQQVLTAASCHCFYHHSANFHTFEIYKSQAALQSSSRGVSFHSTSPPNRLTTHCTALKLCYKSAFPRPI